ncbi:hypothetical protein [Streptomyces sp. GC420]|uniref:hypothetical protein n=1 Tax=Streptomyces sp. GC420 TaxID=2697568 RepID=UPI0014152C85|nr:hypothetical protein [Streptomyces sp. GC420]NBM15639.1 hypothetical protein [Streptomyces sp. GC420]
MKTSAFVYPWDVIGDPDAARRIAGLGVRQVTLASAYHSTRALTPRHPRHRVVTAEHAAVLYPAGRERWAGRRLRPYAPGAWAAGDPGDPPRPSDPFGEAAGALAAEGLDVHSWVVLAHNSRLGAEHPDTSVVNAYGDRYPWAPCIARPEVRSYLVDLAAEAAARPGARGTELESCGWYGFAHLHAHDKVGGAPLGEAAQYLMSLCFCASCAEGYRDAGLDAGELAEAVRRALAPLWAGRTGPPGGWDAVRELLGAELAAATLEFRSLAARTLQEAAVRAVRAAAPEGFQVLLHADPAPHRTGANPGVSPTRVLELADGVVLPCTGPAAGREAMFGPFGDHATGKVLAANLTVVAGMGGSPATLAADAAHAASLGATELRLYHAGLASDQDLALVRKALAEVG